MKWTSVAGPVSQLIFERRQRLVIATATPVTEKGWAV
jgi:hypothetical protein